jgi:hypothetical protein
MVIGVYNNLTDNINQAIQTILEHYSDIFVDKAEPW